MRRLAFYLLIAILASGIINLNNFIVVRSQNIKQKSFFIESQPDSPLLIRDLSAIILPSDDYSSSPKIEVVFFIENRSKKKVVKYQFQDPAEDDTEYKDYNVRGFGGDLLPGESYRQKSKMTVEGKALVYRIRDVEFEDGTKWKAKPFNASNAKKSAPIIAQKLGNEQFKDLGFKRILRREGWASPIFSDRVLKVINGTSQTIEGIKIKTKLHELKPERLDVVESCDVQNDNLEIAYNGFDYDVEKFISYEVKNKVFAYKISYELINGEDGHEIGAGNSYIYVDEEGNGVFKLLCNKTELKSLPKWVKTLAKE